MDAHRMQCLEIWGGSRAADEAVSVPGLDLYVWSQPHGGGESGGDVYLASMCSAGHVARVVLADVAGHGEAVSGLGRTLRGLMREHVGTVDQAELARELNRAFLRESRAGRFATALLVTYFAPTDHLIVVNAGHPPPLFYRARERRWQLLEPGARAALDGDGGAAIGVANLPLGIIEPTPYEQFAVPLEPGDVVLLYTDASIESRDAAGEQLGTVGLLELVRGLDPDDFERLAERIRERLDLRRGGAPPDDDLTLLVLHHNAADPPSLSLGERIRVLGRSLGLFRLEPEL